MSADGTVSKRKLVSEDEKIQTYHLTVSGKDEVPFYPLLRIGRVLYLFPYKSCQGYMIDTETDEVSTTEIFEEEKVFKGDMPLYLVCASDEKYLYAFTGNSHRFISFDLKTSEIKEHKLYVSDQDRPAIEAARVKEFHKHMNGEIVWESEDAYLEDMLKLLNTEMSFEKEER